MTTNTRQELDDLFSMFHDFEIKLLIYQNTTLRLTFILPWGELWDDLNYQIKVELTGCDFIHCDYAEILNTPDNLAKNWVDRCSIDKSTNDSNIISELGLEVQSHKFYSPNKYEFRCNSSKKFAGGQLTFTADNYLILDKDGNKITLNKMQKWCTDWWEKIDNQ